MRGEVTIGRSILLWCLYMYVGGGYAKLGGKGWGEGGGARLSYQVTDIASQVHSQDSVIYS